MTLEPRFRAVFAFVYLVPLFALIFTKGDMFLYGIGLWPVRPVVGMFLLLGPLALTVLVTESRSRWRRALSLPVRNAPLFLPLGGLAVLSGLGALRPDAYWGEGGRFVLYPFYSLLVFGVATLLPLLPTYRRLFPSMVGLAFAVMLATLMIDVLHPGSFAKHAGRAAGFAENPNTAAFTLLLCCCVLVRSRNPVWLNGLVLALTSLGLVTTLSRSGLLLFVLYLGTALCWLLADRPQQAPRHLGMALVGVVALVLSLGAMTVLTRLETGIFARPATRERVEEISRGGLMERDDYRFQLASLYLDQVAEAPFLGHGSGYASGLPKGPHNRYLYEWTNLGIAGLGLYVAWIVGGLWMFWNRRFPPGVFVMVQVAAGSFFSHNVLENRGLLLVLASMATLSLPAIRRSETKPGRGGAGVCEKGDGHDLEPSEPW
jgi:O-antigen ligase